MKITPYESNILAFLARHPDAPRVLDVLSRLKGDLRLVGELLIGRPIEENCSEEVINIVNELKKIKRVKP